MLVLHAEVRQLRIDREPDGLYLYATLRLGAIVVEHNPLYTAPELEQIFAEVQRSKALDVALADVAERYDSKDFRWVVMAIRIQREVGGNLAELLDTVAAADGVVIFRPPAKRAPPGAVWHTTQSPSAASCRPRSMVSAL